MLSRAAGRASFPEVPILALVLAFVAGALAVASGGALVYRALSPRLADTAAQLRTAHDRLYAAWRAGASIPPDDSTAEPTQPEWFDEVVWEWLSQWDDAGRQIYGAKARQLAKQGMDGATIVVSLDRLRTGAIEGTH